MLFRGEMELPFEIMAVVNDDTTIALLKIEDAQGNTTQLTASSKRHPDDTFDPKVGVDLAVARLLRKAANHIERPHRRLLAHEEPVQRYGTVGVTMTEDQAKAAVDKHNARHGCNGSPCSHRSDLWLAVPLQDTAPPLTSIAQPFIDAWGAVRKALNRKLELE